jgi:YggT family protein
MVSVGSLTEFILNFFLFALFGRLIFSYIQISSPTWRPRGVAIYFVEAIYTVTDKPIKFVKRIVPPIRVGGVNLDLSILVLFVLTMLLIDLVKSFSF